jgi:hypothetical protein
MVLDVLIEGEHLISVVFTVRCIFYHHFFSSKSICNYNRNTRKS